MRCINTLEEDDNMVRQAPTSPTRRPEPTNITVPQPPSQYDESIAADPVQQIQTVADHAVAREVADSNIDDSGKKLVVALSKVTKEIGEANVNAVKASESVIIDTLTEELKKIPAGDSIRAKESRSAYSIRVSIPRKMLFDFMEEASIKTVESVANAKKASDARKYTANWVMGSILTKALSNRRATSNIKFCKPDGAEWKMKTDTDKISKELVRIQLDKAVWIKLEELATEYRKASGDRSATTNAIAIDILTRHLNNPRSKPVYAGEDATTTTEESSNE